MFFRSNFQSLKVITCLALISITTSQVSLADGSNQLKTCDQIYSHKAWMWIPKGIGVWTATLAVPVIGNVLGGMELAEMKSQGKLPKHNPVKYRLQVAALLKAATLISFAQQYPERKIPKGKLHDAEKTVSEFYRYYIQNRFPKTKIILEEVINRLTVLNLEGPSLAMCHGLYSRRALANRYFEKGELSIDIILMHQRTMIESQREAAKLAREQQLREENEAIQERNKKSQNKEAILLDINNTNLKEFYDETEANELSSENEMSHLTDYAAQENPY